MVSGGQFHPSSVPPSKPELSMEYRHRLRIDANGVRILDIDGGLLGIGSRLVM